MSSQIGSETTKALRITAHWYRVKEESRLGNNCEDCERLPQVKKILGCSGPAEPDDLGFVMEYDIAGVKTDRCPIALTKDPQVQHILSLYEAYTSGHLPRGSNLSEQSAYFRTCMEICGRLKSEVEQATLEKTKRN